MPNEFQKGGTNREPTFRIMFTGPRTAILHADNAAGQVAAKWGMEMLLCRAGALLSALAEWAIACHLLISSAVLLA